MKSAIKLVKTLFLVCSLTACSQVPRPQGFVCVANVPSSYNLCFDMDKDFDDQGNVLPGHEGVRLALDVDRHINFDADSYASLKAYMQKLKQRLQSCAGGK